MTQSIYVGVDNKARKVKSLYVGVDGVARKVKKVYIGDTNGKAQLCYIDSLVSGNIAVKVEDYYTSNEMPDDIEVIHLYGFSKNFSGFGSITSNTTGLSFYNFVAEDIYYEFGVAGTDYQVATINIYGNYGGHTITVYDTSNNSVVFPKTILTYFTYPYSGSMATSETAPIINLLMNSVDKTLNFKIVID